MTVYLGLGSNRGDRRAHLTDGLAALRAAGVEIERVSPVVESPAWLPADAPGDWNRPFLNLVLGCRCVMSPPELRAACRSIQNELAAPAPSRWAPRDLDIDVLLWGDEFIDSDTLTVPHPQLLTRNFVLSPLAAIAPGLIVPGTTQTVLALTRALHHHIPLWMGILNVTPDSFSDGGELASDEALAARVEAMIEAGVHILDIGAESTRPGARPLTPDEEWHRLAPPLNALVEALRAAVLRPLISVDTYHPTVAARALAAGADIINDVSGLTNPEMIEVARGSRADWVAMHHVTIPADREALIPRDEDPVAHVSGWLRSRRDAWAAAGLDLERIAFDPGIGFGKDPLQSARLLRECAAFRDEGLRLLVGHSRKSFLKPVAGEWSTDRDLMTIGASLNLAAQGVDILRVHDVPSHVQAYRGWSHLLAN